MYIKPCICTVDKQGCLSYISCRFKCSKELWVVFLWSHFLVLHYHYIFYIILKPFHPWLFTLNNKQSPFFFHLLLVSLPLSGWFQLVLQFLQETNLFPWNRLGLHPERTKVKLYLNIKHMLVLIHPFFFGDGNIFDASRPHPACL